MVAAASLVMIIGKVIVIPALRGIFVVGGEGCEGGSLRMLNLTMLVMLTMKGMRRGSMKNSLTVLVFVKIE